MTGCELKKIVTHMPDEADITISFIGVPKIDPEMDGYKVKSVEYVRANGIFGPEIFIVPGEGIKY